MKKIVKIVAPILVLIASIFFVKTLIAAKPKPEKKEPEARLISLFVDKVKSEEVTLNVRSQGEVKAKTEIDIISQVSGQIVEISDNFAEGAEFKENTTLIKIDDTDYKLALISAEARLATAKVALERELANSKIKEQQWKLKKSTVKPSDYALNKPQVAEVKALIRAAEADLQKARLNVARTQIKIPFNGRVKSEDIGLGQYVSAGKVLGRVFATDIVEIKLPLTDTQLSELNIPIGFTAKSDNAPTVLLTTLVGKNLQTWKGKIVRTNASLDQQTRLVYAIAEVQNPYQANSSSDSPLAVGMYVNADISKPNSQIALSVPRNALHKEDKVYVINNDSKLEIRTVDVLSTNAEKVLVASGVSEGENVVTSSFSGTAIDGMEVIALERNDNLTIK